MERNRKSQRRRKPTRDQALRAWRKRTEAIQRIEDKLLSDFAHAMERQP